MKARATPSSREIVTLHGRKITQADRDTRDLNSAARKLRSLLRKNTVFANKPSKNRTKKVIRRPLLQRVAVRITYSKSPTLEGKHPGQWKAHGRYLEREGAQKEGEKALGFGSRGDSMQIASTLETWEREGDPHVFKLIISPEFGEKLDLKDHCKNIVARMEKDLKTRLEWVAVDHHNTANPHVHLCVRGLDERKNVLNLPKDYIKSGIRQAACEHATEKLGYRTERDIREARERQITQQRFTELDFQLKTLSKDNVVSFERTAEKPRLNHETEIALTRRLAQLRSMGLAEKVGHKKWKLHKSHETALRQMQVTGDRLKTLHMHRQLASNPGAQLSVTEFKEPGKTLTGRVIGTGLDEGSQRSYILLEGTDGRIHYINQNSSMEKMRGEGRLQNGSIVRIESVQLKQPKEMVYASVTDFGKKISPELLDTEILAGHTKFSTLTVGKEKTFQNEFLRKAQKREKRIIESGGAEITEGRIKIKDNLNYDRLRYRDKNITFSNLDRENFQPFVGEVLRRGNASIALKSHRGEVFLLTEKEALELGLKHGLPREGSMILVTPGYSRKDKETGQEVKVPSRAMHLKASTTLANIDSDKITAIDMVANRINDLKSEHPASKLAAKRREVWAVRGIDTSDRKFFKKALDWQKGNERPNPSDNDGRATHEKRKIDIISERFSSTLEKNVQPAEPVSGVTYSGKVLFVEKEEKVTRILLETEKSLVVIEQNQHNKKVFEGHQIHARYVNIMNPETGKRSPSWTVTQAIYEKTRSPERTMER